MMTDERLTDEQVQDIAALSDADDWRLSMSTRMVKRMAHELIAARARIAELEGSLSNAIETVKARAEKQIELCTLIDKLKAENARLRPPAHCAEDGSALLPSTGSTPYVFCPKCGRMYWGGEVF